jgi:hypothetical protein
LYQVWYLAALKGAKETHMKVLFAAFLLPFFALCACGPGSPQAGSAASLPAQAAGGRGAHASLPDHAASGAGPGCSAADRARLLGLLRARDADGWRVYLAERSHGQRGENGKFVFDAFLDESCDAGETPDVALSTAVHETVHALRSALGGYDLIGGGLLPDLRADPAEFFPPGRMASQFAVRSEATAANPKGWDPFVENYLGPGQATSAEDFSFLLDELNAYAHDLTTSSRLDGAFEKSPDDEVTPRDGTLALMSFVKRYAEDARRSAPRTWSALGREPYRGAVRTLWAQSEAALRESCRHANMGSEIGARYLKALCDPATNAGLAALLGRAPACPARCL